MENKLNKTISEAREYMEQYFDEGVKCPCCGQFVKRYKRKLNSGMAKTLGRIYAYHPNSYVNVKDFLRDKKYHNGHDWTLLRHWGFLTEKEGMWKITDMGKSWIDHKTPTHSHIYMYNNKMMGFAGEDTITFQESLGQHFDKTELLNE